MKRFKEGLLILVLAISLPSLQSCDPGTIALANNAVIEGFVVDETTREAVIGALVQLIGFDAQAVTDANGRFSITVTLPDTNSVLVQLTISSNDYSAQTTQSFTLRNGSVRGIGAISLRRSALPSGPASNIIVENVESDQVFVKASGATETSNIVFEVRDQAGTPVDLDNQVLVRFSLQGGPQTGEFITPDTIRTNSFGQVTATLNSGTGSGAVQIIAAIEGTEIRSSPVPIAISGWLPDPEHFSVGAEQVNIEGLLVLGLEDKITAFVGDKYSNPVPPNTAVRFSTTGGIIDGVATTDELGRASVQLLTASPDPTGDPEAAPPFNKLGFAKIEAQTVDENNNNISAISYVLFSGKTRIIGPVPGTFDIPVFEGLDFQLIVSDQNGNPLVEGSIISVTTNFGDLTGDFLVTLSDTFAEEATIFNYRLTNVAPNVSGVETTMTVRVFSKNGDASTTITGVLQGLGN